MQLSHFASIALAFVALACAPQTWSPRPVSSPTIAVLCAPAREVWCEWDNPECGSAELAVRQVNEVVPGLLVWKGEIVRESLLAKARDVDHPVTAILRAHIASKDYSGLPIAYTQVNIETTTACIGPTPIVLIWPTEGLARPDWNQCVLHELLHSLGADHASLGTYFSTVMHPALTQEHRVGLSKADKAWLRAVYGS